MGLNVKCDKDCVQDADGHNFFCHFVSGDQEVRMQLKLHVQLMRDVPSKKVTRKGDRMMIPMSQLIALGPFATRRIILPFRIMGTGLK